MNPISLEAFKNYCQRNNLEPTPQLLDGARLAIELVNALPVGLPGLFNPYREDCLMDANNSQTDKFSRLALHFATSPLFICAGEAPGYQGCHYSGVAFTSERLLMEGAIPRTPISLSRLSTGRKTPFSEPSATIVWGALKTLQIHERTILWNALQLHPFKKEGIWTNRTPTDDEIKRGRPAMELLVSAFPKAKLVAVGNKSAFLLQEFMNLPVYACVRHPANGGATKFREGMAALSAQDSLS